MSESRTSKEFHRRVFDLTLALYRVSDFFPQGEALRKQLREKANDIFGFITEYGYTAEIERESFFILGKIESLKGYLAIARSMSFVRPINISVLEREYEGLADFFRKELERAKTIPEVLEEKKTTQKELEELPTWAEFSQKENAHTVPLKQKKNENLNTEVRSMTSEHKPSEGELNNRQKRILERLQEINQAKISDFFAFFDGISSKTIQRDLQDLVTKNLLKKDGEKRWTIYTLNVL